MKSFQVLITPDAENDLIELSKYIAQELLSPQVARDYLSFADGNRETLIPGNSFRAHP